MTKRIYNTEPRRYWTQEEDAAMRELWANAGMGEIMSRLPGRTRWALHSRAVTLGIGRPEGGIGPRYIRPGYLRWLPEEDTFLRDHYPTTMLVDEIAKTTGHPKEAVMQRARQLHLKRPKHTGPQFQMSPASVLTLTLAAKDSGANAADLVKAGLGADVAYRSLARLTKRGMLHRGELGHKTVRYFTTRAAADRYVTANLSAHLAKAKAHTRPAAIRQAWAPDAPTYYPKNPDGSPAYKVTICPSPGVSLRTNTYAEA